MTPPESPDSTDEPVGGEDGGSGNDSENNNQAGDGQGEGIGEPATGFIFPNKFFNMFGKIFK